MLAERHSHRLRVVALLEAARTAMATVRFEPFAAGEAIGLEVLLRCPLPVPGDATNYLGGIGDVLQGRRVNANLEHLGELADVAVYPDDRAIQEIRYRLERATSPSYTVLLWSQRS